MAVVVSPVCIGFCPCKETGKFPVTNRANNCVQLRLDCSLEQLPAIYCHILLHSHFPPLPAQALGQEQSNLMESSVEKRAPEINCNGVIPVTDFTNSGNEGSVRLEDDLHNANDCGNRPHTQKTENFHSCNYTQHNSDSENRPQEAMSDSFVPLAPEDSMVCQPTSNEQQAFSEQINNFQESIRTEIPSEDENENNGPTDNKGIRGTL